ncbi:mortality factor 4-like protein 1 [Dreissena polymorpha]|nr:mortality factor 4-like protein 1 [Dreissena polymorpha]XP_052248104.1 mortality factor 4-like protein 1 [Dreissena polymorpha]
MGPKPKFQDEEKVLCFHGPLLYEAKCMKSELRDRAFHYFVHYNGWNKNWDEWVPETRILKLNDAGLQKQKECYAALKAEKAKNREKAKEAKDAGLPVPGKTKKKKEKEKEVAAKEAKDGKEAKDRTSTPTVEKKKETEKEKSISSTPTSGKSKVRETRETKDRETKDRETKDRVSESEKERPSKLRDKTSDSDKDRSSRASTPTSVSSKRSKDADKTDRSEKDKTSRSSTPTLPPSAKRQKVERAAATAAASQISQQAQSGTSTPQPTAPPPSQETSTPSTPASQASSEQKRKRARLDQTIESEESYLTKIEVKVKIPDELKPWLVDDWDLVTRQKQLVTLPCKFSVDKILDDYLQVKLTKPNHPNKDTIIEVNNGIREYFNAMLGTQLLYKFERPQYGTVLSEHEDKPMSSVYGATHLLRLFVKLGSMLAYTALDEKSIQILLHHVQDFLKYLQRNAATFFNLSDYHVASPEYHRKAM